MSILYNGTDIPTTGEILFNTTSLTEVIYNGVTVWKKSSIEFYYKVYAKDSTSYVYIEKYDSENNLIEKVYEKYYDLDWDNNQYIELDMIKLYTNINEYDDEDNRIDDSIVVIFSQNVRCYKDALYNGEEIYVNKNQSVLIPIGFPIVGSYDTKYALFIIPE